MLAGIVLENADIGSSTADSDTKIGRGVVTEVIARVAPHTSLLDGVTWHVDVVLSGSACTR